MSRLRSEFKSWNHLQIASWLTIKLLVFPILHPQVTTCVRSNGEFTFNDAVLTLLLFFARSLHYIIASVASRELFCFWRDHSAVSMPPTAQSRFIRAKLQRPIRNNAWHHSSAFISLQLLAVHIRERAEKQFRFPMTRERSEKSARATVMSPLRYIRMMRCAHRVRCKVNESAARAIKWRI